MGGTPTYLKRTSRLWWLRNPRYFLYMLREISSLFVFLYILVFLGLLLFLGNEASYEALRALVVSRPFVIFTLVTLAFALLHSATWWRLTSRVLQVPYWDRTLSPLTVLLLLLVGWALASLAVYYLIFLRGL